MSMNQFNSFLYDLRGVLQSVKRENEKELKTVQKQIEALGEEPQEGVEEIESIALKRKEFKNNEAILKSKIAETDVLQVKSFS